MNTKTKTTILRELQEYYEKDISSQQAATYLRLLSDLPDDKLRMAADIWMQNNKWFPKANELLQLGKEDPKAYKQLSIYDSIPKPIMGIGNWSLMVADKEYDGCPLTEDVEFKDFTPSEKVSKLNQKYGGAKCQS